MKPGPNRLAVTGIGNAMLDIISQDSHEVYRQLGLVKASMSLIQEDQLETFFNAMGPTIQMSGGSVANSIAGVAALGGTCGYIGKVADDDFGKRFRTTSRRWASKSTWRSPRPTRARRGGVTCSSPTTPSAPWRPTSARPTNCTSPTSTRR